MHSSGSVQVPVKQQTAEKSIQNFGKHVNMCLLGQWLNFKLFGIAYLVGEIKFKLFFSGSIG